MAYGVPIDDDFLRTLPEYKNKTTLTAKDRSTVALQQKFVYRDQAIKRLDELKSDFGDGVSTLCLVYNATGDTITCHDTQSWKGHFYKQSPENSFENGQWSIFMHVKPSVLPEGCTGAVIYRTKQHADVFLGWQNPWTPGYDTSCWAECRAWDHWWGTGSKSFMEHLLYDKARSTHEDSSNGYKANISMGDSTTSYCEAAISLL